MNRDRLLQTFLELAATPSPSQHERPVADYVRAQLEAIGLTVHEDNAAAQVGGDAGNLIAKLPGQGEPLLLAAHMDTVPLAGEVRPKVEGNRVYAAGDTILGADDKSAVAVLIELARELSEQGAAHRPLELVFTVGEETGLAGAKALDYSLLTAREGYALDGSDPARVVRGAPSNHALDITIHGRGGHATKPDDTINPIRVAADAIARMPLGALGPETTANVGVIHAGSAVNVVPETAQVLMEVRSHDERMLEFYTDQAVLCVEQAAAAARLPAGDEVVAARAEIKRTRCYDAYRLEEEDALVQRAMQAITAVGLKPRSLVGRGGQDANVFNRRGIRSVALGTGAYAPHTTREYLVISEMLLGLEVAWQLTVGGAA